MADEPLGPDTFSTRDLPTARRGYEKKAVEALIAEAVERWGTLERRHRDLLKDVAGSGGSEALARDVEAVGSEVSRILEAAKEAAEGMRSRAREDSERVAAEAAAEAASRLQAGVEEAATIVAEGERQAFELRRDAWDGGTTLISSAQETGEEIIAEAGEQALSIRADAERDSHQRLALTRRESDDVIRNARYEADRLLNQARALAQTIIDRASDADGDDESGFSPADDRGRHRRIEEVERLHAERSIEGVAVLPAEPRRDTDEVGFGALDSGSSDLSDALAAEVEQMNGPPISPRANERAPGDDVGSLFEALRTTADHDPVGAGVSRDPIAVRDRLVLPVHNEGLRDVKRRIVDLQSETIDALRRPGWSPARSRIAGELAAALGTAIQKAGTAGSTGAEAIAGVQRVRSRPGPRPGELVEAMAEDLTGQLQEAVQSEGGPSEVAATVSRVFRAWRGDEAERWVRMVVFAAYHDSFLAAVAVGGWTEVEGRPSGRSCERCAGSDRLRWDPQSGAPEGYLIPPANLDCICTVTVAD
jgi:cell division septum initiation protein DivIVA